MERLPLLDFDPALDAVITPSAPRVSERWPTAAVLCYFHEQIAALAQRGTARRIGRFSVEMGGHGIYAVDRPGDEPVAVFHPGVGAPVAVHALERAIAGGCRSFVVCGGAGALVPMPLGGVVVPTGAIRDEGTSFHYAPPGAVVPVDPDTVATLAAVLDDRSVPYTTGLTWTTDAPFRETRDRIAARRAAGCLTVEMEASALLAAAGFRGVRLAALLYAADDLSGPVWDSRNWTRAEVRATLLSLAIEAASGLRRAA
jgi:uridine phosphorylase